MTAEDYNKQVFTLSMVSSGAFMQAPGSHRADSTRYLATKAILYNLYKERKLQAAGMDSVLDSVSAVSCKQDYSRSDTAWAKRLPKFYKDHFQSNFQARRVPVFDVIAGSDSIYIHSIFGFLERQDSLLKASTPRDTMVRRRAMGRIDSLPWRRVAMDDLGPAALKAAKVLDHSKWSSPIRTPYGFAILSLADSIWTQEVFFPAIRDSLRLVLKGQETAFIDQAKSYYRSNKHKYPMPDTLSFKLTVCPDSNCALNPKQAKALPIASEYLLPTSTRDVLKSTYRSQLPDSVWLETPLGFVHMGVSKLRSGKGSRPFDDVKWGIFKHIDALVDSSIIESVKCMQLRRRIADRFVPYLYEDVAAILHDKGVLPGAKTRDPALLGSIKETRTRFHGEFDSWLQALSIELPGL